MTWPWSKQIVETKNGVIQIVEALGEALNEYTLDCSNEFGRLKAYKKCDPVAAVIKKSSSFIANLKVWALDENGKQVKSRLAKQVIDKIKNPNPKEDFKLFFRKLDIYCKLHGKAYVQVFNSLIGETFYYVIPNTFITEYYKTSVNSLFEREVDYYLINDGVSSYRLSPDEVHIFYDGRLSNGIYEILGGSALESLSEPISTYIVLNEVRTELYGDGGARNLIALGGNTDEMLIGLTNTKEKESLYDNLKKFGFRRSQRKNLVVNTDAKVWPLTSKMSDMGFSETVKDLKKAICNAYEIPPELFGIESSRFKTVPEARKEAYTQCAIPSLEYYFAEFLKMMSITPDFILNADYSHLDFYQESKKETAIALQQTSNAITNLWDKEDKNGQPIITAEEARTWLDLE